MEHVYPKLKDYCRDRYGIEFQVTIKLDGEENYIRRNRIFINKYFYLYVKFFHFIDINNSRSL